MLRQHSWPLLLILACLGRASRAEINTRLTPIDLMRQSQTVVQVQLQPAAGSDVSARIVEEIKGRAAGLALTLRLKEAGPRVRSEFRKAAAEKQVAVLFAGAYRQRGTAIEASGMIHAGGQWYDAKTTGDVWVVGGSRPDLRSTWDGASPLLARLAQYIVRDPQPVVPSEAGVKWGACKRLHTFVAPVHGAMAVDLAGDGKLSLFVAAESGDRIYRWRADQQVFQDITDGLKLASRSRLFAWGDFDGDGRLDLASFDGHVLTLWAQSREGAFATRAVCAEIPESCLGLSPLDVGLRGRAGILASTSGEPFMLVFRPEGNFQRYPVAPAGQQSPAEPSRYSSSPDPGAPAEAGGAGGGGNQARLGRARPCLAADFDGDGTCDILQPFTRGSLFYSGRRAGSFASPVLRKEMASGEGRASLLMGDFDADGLLDVLVCNEEGCLLWQNGGGGRFEAVEGLCGELSYLCRAHALLGQVCDINNDGWQDVAIFYPDAAPQVFFNRGYRSFGQAESLDLSGMDSIPDVNQGQQGGVVADLIGNGAQAMAMVLKNGELWVALRDPQVGPTSAVEVALPLGQLGAGPLNVKVSAAHRELGAWVLLPGLAPAKLGLGQSQSCHLQWQWPGGEVQSKSVATGRIVLPGR